MNTETKMTDEFIAELLAGNKTKGQYEAHLREFADSDEAVINPREAWPLLYATKSASAMYQSFNNAKQKLNGTGEPIKILARNGEIFIMHTDRVQLRLNPVEAVTDGEPVEVEVDEELA